MTTYVEDAEPAVKVIWWLVFISAWIYCISEYGFLLGLGLGWIASAILATLVGLTIAFTWPLLLLVFCSGGLFIYFHGF